MTRTNAVENFSQTLNALVIVRRNSLVSGGLTSRRSCLEAASKVVTTLRAGIGTVGNNMIVLVAMGWNLELDIGKVKFLIVYFVSGLAGNVLSAWWDIQTGSMAISAGASGAIFGIIGALLYVAIRNRGRIGDISGRGLVFMIVLTLYYGFTSGGVDNMAHIGGLLAGFLSGVLLYRKRKDKYRTGISC